MKPRRRIWWHCSQTYHGLTWSPPRRPPSLRGEGEPLTPRLAVAGSVCGCFAARLFTVPADVYAYRTAAPRATVKPVGVGDAVITGERWLIPPAVLVLADVIPGEVVEAACRDLAEHVRRHGAPHWRIRLAAYARALNVLTAERPGWAEPWERKFLSRACTHFGIDVKNLLDNGSAVS